MDRSIDLIKDSALLKPLPGAVVLELVRSGSAAATEYLKDTVVHFEGDGCAALEVILEGRIALERLDASGRILTVGEFLKGDILGGNLLFSRNASYPMTAVTRERTLLLGIKKDALFALLTGNPDFLLTYLEFISDNAVVLGEKIRHEIKKPIRDCVIDFLEAERAAQKTDRITLKITKKALAERIGVQRTSLSRELAKMRRDGMITSDASSITILDLKSNL